MNPDHKVHQADHNIDIPPNNDNPFSVFDNEKVEVFDQTDTSFESMPADTASVKSLSKRGLSARHIQMISLGGCIG
jgi:amino acid permease